MGDAFGVIDHVRNANHLPRVRQARKVKMKNHVKAVPLVLMILFAGAISVIGIASAVDTAHAAEVTLLYNGSVNAELHDCGCKKRPLGGLARRAALIDELSTGHDVLLLDAGNLMGDPTRDSSAQSSFVAVQTAAMGYEVVGMGAYEFGHGADAVRQAAQASGLRFVSANLDADDNAGVERWVVVERDGVRFGVTSVIDPGYDRAPYDEGPGGLRITDPVAALERELPLLRAECDVVVLLANMEGSEGSLRLLQELGDGAVDIVIDGAGSRQNRRPLEVGTSLVLAANGRGKYLGETALVIEGGTVTAPSTAVHALDVKLPEDEGIAHEVSEFEATQETLAQSR
ncbi:hypothetical protein DRQ53_03305 [bacterium]|nr:MAG: hypothetical protein DRQ32_03615 [bacterium]RKZ17493.1 MAG: hypothetical protein DRQ53_03305 [bacterium]